MDLLSINESKSNTDENTISDAIDNSNLQNESVNDLDEDLNEDELDDELDDDLDDELDDELEDEVNNSDSDLNDSSDNESSISDIETFDESNDIQVSNMDDKLVKVDDSDRITKPILTKYEFNRIYGIRLKHITSGGKLLIKSDNITDSREQVKNEIRAKKSPMIIRRNLPNNLYEDWKLSELHIPEILFM